MLSYETLAATVAEADEYAQGRARVDWAGRSEDRCAGPRPDYIAGLYSSHCNFEFDDETAPQVVMYAIIEAAHRELVAPGSLMPEVVGTERVLREKVGDLEVQYADAKETEGRTLAGAGHRWIARRHDPRCRQCRDLLSGACLIGRPDGRCYVVVGILADQAGLLLGLAHRNFVVRRLAGHIGALFIGCG